MQRTSVDLTDIVLCYGASGENARQARIMYIERFPRRNPPNERTFVAVVQQLRDHGMFHSYGEGGRPRSDNTTIAEEEILQAVQENPRVSTRRLTMQLGRTSNFITWRTLNEDRQYPFHVRKVQALHPQDYGSRREYCQWFTQKFERKPDWVRSVIFTDEAGFTRDGVFNQHNTHIWSHENPHAIRESHHQREFSLNVWAGIIDNRLIGPHIMPARLNAQAYLEFLRNDLPNYLDEVPLAVHPMWFLHDGAPCHNAGIVNEFLDQEYPGRWIGRSGPIIWPPRSPDLNPCDFFLWGTMKQIVYSEQIENIDQLQNRIEMAAEQIRNMENIFARVRDNMVRRTYACLEANGGHFEHIPY